MKYFALRHEILELFEKLIPMDPFGMRDIIGDDWDWVEPIEGVFINALAFRLIYDGDTYTFDLKSLMKSLDEIGMSYLFSCDEGLTIRSRSHQMDVFDVDTNNFPGFLLGEYNHLGEYEQRFCFCPPVDGVGYLIADQRINEYVECMDIKYFLIAPEIFTNDCCFRTPNVRESNVYRFLLFVSS